MTPFELAVLFKIAKVADMLVDDALQDDRTEVLYADIESAGQRNGVHPATLIKVIVKLGATIGERPTIRRVRGFTSSSNDRWFGPGADRCHGGAGFSGRYED